MSDIDPHVARATGRSGSPIYAGLQLPPVGGAAHALNTPGLAVAAVAPRGTVVAVRLASGHGRYWWVIQPGNPYAGLTIAQHDPSWSVAPPS